MAFTASIFVYVMLYTANFAAASLKSAMYVSELSYRTCRAAVYPAISTNYVLILMYICIAGSGGAGVVGAVGAGAVEVGV